MQRRAKRQARRGPAGTFTAMTIAAFLLGAGSSRAQSNGCDLTAGTDWEAAFAACDAVIKAGGAPARELAMAYLNRGIVWNARAWRSQLQQAQTDWQYSIDDFTAAIRIDPTLAIAYTDRGASWTIRHGTADSFAPVDPGDFDHAMADFTAAIRIDPKSALSYELRGGLQIERYNRASLFGSGADAGDIDRGIADYTAAIGIDPLPGSLKAGQSSVATAKHNAYADRGGAYVLKASFLQVGGNNAGAADSYARAIADYGEAVRLEPNSPDNHDHRAAAYSNRADLVGLSSSGHSNDNSMIADYTAAVAELDAAIRLAPTGQRYAYRAQAYYDRAEVRDSRDDKSPQDEQAIAADVEAIKKDCAASAASDPQGTSFVCGKINK